MGKLLLCTNPQILEKINNTIPDFTESGRYTGAFGQLRTFHKLRFHTQNVLVKEQNAIAATGTFLYKGETGEKALMGILEAFDGNLSIRDHIVGSYCICVFFQGKVYLFVDAASTYSIYYHLSQDNKEIILTNTYYHVAKGMEKPLIFEDGLVDTWFHKTIDRTTPITDVYKLMGDECLVFENQQWSFMKMPQPLTKDSMSVEEKARWLYQGIDQVFPSSGVFMTGGQDSRISLALMLALGMRPTLYYGIGNSSNTSTKTEDMNIVREISEKFDLPMETMNWNESDEAGQDAYMRKYGEWFALYRMNKNIFREFEERIQASFVALGYFGEVFRTIEPIEAYSKAVFSLDEYLDDIYLSDCKAAFSPEKYVALKERIREQFASVCSARGIDESRITKDQFQILNTVYRQRWDTLMNNFANQFVYSIPLFGNVHLTRKTEAICYEERLNSKHLMETIYGLYPEMLEIPFFSHIKVKKYNPVTHELTNKEYVSSIKDVIRSMIRSERMMRFARNVYYLLRGDKKGRQETSRQYADKEALLEEYKQLVNFSGIDVDVVFRMQDARGIKEILLIKKMLNSICG